MNNSKMLRKNDILLLIGLLLIGAILFIVVNVSQNDGGVVEVQVDGEVIDTYDLAQNREISLDYNGHNQLVIQDGMATITDADCPDKLCVEQRSISRSGETIVCLPHKTVIIINDGEESEFDGVVQ